MSCPVLKITSFLSNDIDEDVQSDSEIGDGTEGNLVVCLSREEKALIMAVWRKALIIKAFGRKVGYNYLYPKIRSLWNPCGKMDCIDLGSDYFLIKFDLEEDVDRERRAMVYWTAISCY